MTMKQIFKRLNKKIKDQIDEYRKSVIFRRYPAQLFDNVRYYVMFIGYAHSGHSLVGALLDAHPNMVVANELHALPLFKKYNYDKYKIFKLVMDNSVKCAAMQDRTNTGYNYYIPNLYQGKYERLEVVGDKKGGATAVYNLKYPEVMDNLIKLLGSSLKVIHVVRNPYDNISAYAYRLKCEVNKELIEEYFRHADSILSCKSKLPDDQFYTVFYEELTHNKEAELTKLCNFLGQAASPEYLKQCSNAIYDSPHKRRHSIEWTDENKALVRSYMHSDKYKIFFAQYEF